MFFRLTVGWTICKQCFGQFLLLQNKQRLESRKAYRFFANPFCSIVAQIKAFELQWLKNPPQQLPHTGEYRFVTIRVHRRAFSCFSLSAASLPRPTIVLMMNVYGATLFSHLSFLPRQLHIKQFHNRGVLCSSVCLVNQQWAWLFSLQMASHQQTLMSLGYP